MVPEVEIKYFSGISSTSVLLLGPGDQWSSAVLPIDSALFLVVTTRSHPLVSPQQPWIFFRPCLALQLFVSEP